MNYTFLALSKVLGELSEDLEMRAYGKAPKHHCEITDKEAGDLIKELAIINNKQLSKAQACKFLNMSRATFDRKVAEGLIPKGTKSPGWKELSWNRAELEQLIPHHN